MQIKIIIPLKHGCSFIYLFFTSNKQFNILSLFYLICKIKLIVDWKWHIYSLAGRHPNSFVIPFHERAGAKIQRDDGVQYLRAADMEDMS